MDKTLKDKAIDIMKQLLDYAKTLPIFSVEFDVTADNKSIEEYLIAHVDRSDWEGIPLTDDEIQNNISNAIERFHNSKGYNNLGTSTLTMRKAFNLQIISFDNVYEIVSGKCKDMPKEYKFVGEMKLADFNNG